MRKKNKRSIRTNSKKSKEKSQSEESFDKDKDGNILLHKIKNIGLIYYDVELDQLFFRNRFDKIYPITNKTRQININNKNNNYVKFKSIWEGDSSYEVGDMVNFNNELFICINEGNEENPLENKKWFNISNNINLNSVNMNSSENDNFEKGKYFSVFINGSCCSDYDDLTGKSFFNSLKCKFKHKSPSESKMYNYMEIKILKSLSINMPLLYITKNNKRYFDFDFINKMIDIKKGGDYRVTYNITYHGTIYNVQSGVIIYENSKEHIIPFSINKSKNRLFDDRFDDNFYLDVNNVENIETVINHSFLLTVKNEIPIKISLNLTFTKLNLEKRIYIHPIKTWMLIESI